MNNADPIQSQKIKWAYTTLIMIIVWFALVLQFTISIPAYQAQGRTIAGSLVQLVSFFTILSNLLVVISITILLTKPGSTLYRFFSKSSVLTGIAVYITIVGLVYNLVLRHIWQPQGLFKLADELLHTINPTLFIIYWLAFVPKEGLMWDNILSWLWFPFIYLVYVIIRGAFTGYYPYPFVDVLHLGYTKVMINSFLLLMVFLGFGALFVLIDRWQTKIAKAVTSR